MKKALPYVVAAAVAALVIAPFLPPLWAQTPSGTYSNGGTTSHTGTRIGGTDGTVDRDITVDASGNVQTMDRTTDDIRLETNIRSNNGLKTKFVSAVIDLRRFGPWKTLAIRAIGPTTASTASIYVGIEGSYSSVFDSTSAFPFSLGRSNPAGTGTGMRTVAPNFTVLSDSTIVARPAELIPLADSISGAPFIAPYARITVQTTSTQANNLYLHIFGGIR